MIKAYTIAELAKEEKVTAQGIMYRIKNKSHYIAVRLDGAAFAKNKKGYTIRYIKKADLSGYLFEA